MGDRRFCGLILQLLKLELGNGIYVSISDTPVTRPETDNAGLSSRDRGKKKKGGGGRCY